MRVDGSPSQYSERKEGQKYEPENVLPFVPVGFIGTYLCAHWDNWRAADQSRGSCGCHMVLSQIAWSSQ